MPGEVASQNRRFFDDSELQKSGSPRVSLTLAAPMWPLCCTLGPPLADLCVIFSDILGNLCFRCVFSSILGASLGGSTWLKYSK